MRFRSIVVFLLALVVVASALYLLAAARPRVEVSEQRDGDRASADDGADAPPVAVTDAPRPRSRRCSRPSIASSTRP